MAIDHFEKYFYREDRVDWNFNILFPNQPNLEKLVGEYKPLLNHEGLYEPIPFQWIHSTILRVGLLEDFTEQEMLKVADCLQIKLASLHLPEFGIDSWWLSSGNVVLHISPDDVYRLIHSAVIEALHEVFSVERMLSFVERKFTPHITLAYTRTQTSELEVARSLTTKPAGELVTFEATQLSLIKQWPVNGHYEWEVVRTIPIGNSGMYENE